MLGGFLGGLANLGTIYGGYQQAQARDQALQQALQQQQALTLLGQGLGQLKNLPTATAQPGTATPGATPAPSPLQPLTTTTPASAPAPSPQLQQTAAAGPLGLEGITGGGPLGMPGLPPMSGFGGGAPPAALPSLGGLQPSPAGGPGLPGFGGGGGTITPTGLPQEQASLANLPRLGVGTPAAPLGDGGLQTADSGLGPPPDWQGPIQVGATTLNPQPGAPRLQGLGGQQMPSQIPAGGPGIVQPRGGFGLGGYKPFTPAAPQAAAQQPQTADAGTAAAPRTADTGTVEGQITSILRQRGWSDGAIQGALANGMAESGLKPWGETGAAGEQGIWQFNPSGELPGYQQAYGSSHSVADQTNYMAARVEQTMPSYTKIADAKLATDTFMRGFERPATAAAGSRYQYIDAAHRQLDNDVDQTGSHLIRTGQASGPTVQDSTKTAMLAGRMIDPSQWGRVALTTAVEAIEKANPSAPDAVKALAIMQLYKLLAPEDKMGFQYMMLQNREAFQQELQDQRLRDQDWRTQFTADVREQIAAQSQAGQDRRLAQREAAINVRHAESLAERQRQFDTRTSAASGKLTAEESAQLRRLKAQQVAMNNQAARYGGWIGAPDELRTARDTVDQEIDDLLGGVEKRTGAPQTKPLKETPTGPPPVNPDEPASGTALIPPR